MKNLILLLFSFVMLVFISPPAKADIIKQHQGKILKENVFVNPDVIGLDAAMVFKNRALNVGINEAKETFILNRQILSSKEGEKQLYKKWQYYPLQCYLYKSEHLTVLSYIEIGYSIKS